MDALRQTAEDLQLDVQVAIPGYLRVSGATAEVLRAWAVAGYDRRTEPGQFIFSQNGAFAGMAVAENGFCHSWTSAI